MTAHAPSGPRAEAADSRQADVRDMAIVHQYYRREFELAPRILRSLLPSEHDRRAAAQDWFAITLFAMHHHHLAEDELMYPLMHGRVPTALLDLMDDQHQAVDAAVQLVDQRLASWIADEPGSLEALALAYEDMLPVLVRHLDDEEREIVPLIAGSLTAEQYSRLATSGNEQDPRVLMLAFGAMIEQCSHDDAQFMLSHLPDRVLQTWYDHRAAEYAAAMQLLRGGLEPIPASFGGQA